MRTASGMTWDQLGRLNFAIEHAAVSADFRRKAAKDGAALPDGSFYIYNQSDLENAVHDIGRTNQPRSTVLAHIKKRAKALGLKMPPSIQNGDGDS